MAKQSTKILVDYCFPIVLHQESARRAAVGAIFYDYALRM